MKKCGHEVFYLNILEKKIKNQVHINHIKKYKPDMVWVLSPFYIQYNVLSKETMSYLKINNVSVAMYCTYNPDVPYVESMSTWKQIDYLFLQNKEMADFLKGKGLNSHYIPLGFYPCQYYKTSYKKKYDISFMGNALTYVPLSEDYRSIYLQSLSNYKIKVFGASFKGRLHDIPISEYRGHNIQRTVYGQTKINLDIPFVNYKSDFYKNRFHWKNRSFEVPATCNFLLTIRCPETEELFGEDTVGYYDPNIESLKESVDKYLKDGDLRKQMAKKSYRLVNQKHTYLNRFEEMFKIIKNS